MTLQVSSFVLIVLGVLTIVIARRIFKQAHWPAYLGGTMIVLGVAGFTGLGALIILAIGSAGLIMGGLLMAAWFVVPGWRRWPFLLGGFMLTVGVAGFCGQGFSAAGGLNWLPQSFEWPAGSVDGAITTQNDLRVVPTTAGRVQVYDADWNFLRGWHIGPGATGAFSLRPLAGNHFEIITARGNYRYQYDTDGELISQGTYDPEDYDALTHFGEPAVVPTAWWLRPFSSPIIAGLIMAAGLGVLFFTGCIKSVQPDDETPKVFGTLEVKPPTNELDGTQTQSTGQNPH